MIFAVRPSMTLLLGLVLSFASCSPLSAQDTSHFEFLDPLFGLSQSYDLRSMILAAHPESDAEEMGGMRFLNLGNDEEYLCIVEASERYFAKIYCFGVIRDQSSGGKIVDLSYDGSGPIDIQHPDGSISQEFERADLGFTPGPGGHDFISIYYDKIGLAQWLQASDGRPKLNVVHYMDVENIFDDGAYGLAFSNIIQDPGTGHGMLFATVYDAMVEIPLIPSGSVYDIDYGNVRFLCNLDSSSLTIGDLRLIQGGAYANDYVVTEYSDNGIYILDIDESTGYPVGVDGSTHVPYMLPYTPDTDLHADGPMCPLRRIINPGPTFSSWGAAFDEQTGDYFFSHFESNKAVVFQIEGFESTMSPSISQSPSEIPSSVPSSGPTLSSQPSSVPSSGPSPSPAEYSNFIVSNLGNGGCSYDMSYEGSDFSFANKAGASEEGTVTNQCRKHFFGKCIKRRWTCTFNNIPQEAPSDYYTAIEACANRDSRVNSFKWGRLEVDSTTNTATLICVACDPAFSSIGLC